jgi:hypothetical protein
MNAPMTPHLTDTARRDDDFDARTRRIRARILDGIEETLDELAQPRALHAATPREEILSEVRRAVQAQCAALLCRQALCRRTRSCRREPCVVLARVYGHAETAQRIS